MFKRATRCGSSACVEVAISMHEVRVRDSKSFDDGTLTFSHEEWAVFVEGVKRGEFDLDSTPVLV